jgi:hypothetical protein
LVYRATEMGEVPVALGVPFHKNEHGVNRYGFFRVTKIGGMAVSYWIGARSKCTSSSGRWTGDWQLFIECRVGIGHCTTQCGPLRPSLLGSPTRNIGVSAVRHWACHPLEWLG